MAGIHRHPANGVFLQSVASGFSLTKFHTLSGAFVDYTLDGASEN
jgi:hypothetical protein